VIGVAWGADVINTLGDTLAVAATVRGVSRRAGRDAGPPLRRSVPPKTTGPVCASQTGPVSCFSPPTLSAGAVRRLCHQPVPVVRLRQSQPAPERVQQDIPILSFVRRVADVRERLRWRHARHDPFTDVDERG
jgi:hypothetical protein